MFGSNFCCSDVIFLPPAAVGGFASAAAVFAPPNDEALDALLKLLPLPSVGLAFSTAGFAVAAAPPADCGFDHSGCGFAAGLCAVGDGLRVRTDVVEASDGVCERPKEVVEVNVVVAGFSNDFCLKLLNVRGALAFGVDTPGAAAGPVRVVALLTGAMRAIGATVGATAAAEAGAVVAVVFGVFASVVSALLAGAAEFFDVDAE